MLTTTPTTRKYIDPSILQDMKKKVPEMEGKWNDILSKRNNIMDDINQVITEETILRKPSSYVDPNISSLKMQKQKDIIEQIDYDNHLMIITGSVLALCLLSVFGIYSQIY